jgi:hypothetical protein
MRDRYFVEDVTFFVDVSTKSIFLAFGKTVFRPFLSMKLTLRSVKITTGSYHFLYPPAPADQGYTPRVSRNL